jgi:hypothetical protein
VYLGTQPAIGQNRKLDSIAASFNGVLTTFSLTVNTQSVVPSNVYQLFISLGGVLQDPGVDFTANGNQITFTTAPVSGLSFFGVFQGDSITGTPTIADASITTLKLATGLTITNTAGTAGAPSVTFAGDTNTGIYSPGADQVAITTGGTGRLFIDSSGRLLVGTSTARSNFFGTTLSSLTQTEGTGGSTARGSLSVINNDVSNNPPYVLLGRSGAATLGSNAVVVSGSRLGTLTFHGADGTSFIEAATVAGEVDGTPGTNDMPGRLVFSTTADGAASPTERLRIDSSGRVGVGTSTVDQLLHLKAANPVLEVEGTASSSGDTGIHFKANANEWFVRADNSTGTNTFSIKSGSPASSTHRFLIDSSGRCGIGTASPGSLNSTGNQLVVGSGTGNQGLTIFAGSSSDSNIYFADGTAGTAPNIGYIQYRHASDRFDFGTNDTTRMSIDSSGRLLVGTSSSSVAASLVCQATSASSTAGTQIWLQRGQAAASISSGDTLGRINFADNAGSSFAWIDGQTDGGAGTNDYPGRLVFATTADGNSSPTERMRIASDGTAYTRGTTSVFSFASNAGAGTTNWLQLGGHSAASITGYTISYAVYTNGNVVNTNGSYTAISDAKLKENIVDAGSQWSDFKAIQIRNWNFKAETGHETHRQIGPIAQELETVCPGLVFETPDRDEDGNETGEVTKGVNQSVLYMKAVKALQEAMERIETLEADVAQLKGA